MWSTAPLLCDVGVGAAPLEYKYVRLLADGGTEWEVEGENRKARARNGVMGASRPYVQASGVRAPRSSGSGGAAFPPNTSFRSCELVR